MNKDEIPRGTTFLMAAACGLIVANLYYAQTLVGPIGRDLGMSPQSKGLIVTMSQMGYCLGLLLLVPLADLLENRRLIVAMTLTCAVALVLLSQVTQPFPFLVLSLLIGMASVAVQVVVPFAAHLASDERRGRVVGRVMGGLMLGIMLARPAASAVAEIWGWRAVFLCSSAVMLVSAGILWRWLPQRLPETDLSYSELVRSLANLLMDTPLLRERGLYQALLFGAFSLFWTAVPLYLAGPDFALSQGHIALFSLAGVAGVVAAPVAGILADQGRLVLVTIASMVLVSVSFLLPHVVSPGSSAYMGLLVLAAIGIDFGVTANLVVSQREIYSLNPALRSRLNGLFIALFFVGGACGSGLGAWAFERGGWSFTSFAGAGLPILALVVFAGLRWKRLRVIWAQEQAQGPLES